MHNARRFLPAHLPLRVAHSAIEHSSQSPRFTSPQPANEFVRTAPRRTDKYAHKQQWRGAAPVALSRRRDGYGCATDGDGDGDAHADAQAAHARRSLKIVVGWRLGTQRAARHDERPDDESQSGRRDDSNARSCSVRCICGCGGCVGRSSALLSRLVSPPLHVSIRVSEYSRHLCCNHSYNIYYYCGRATTSDSHAKFTRLISLLQTCGSCCALSSISSIVQPWKYHSINLGISERSYFKKKY